MRYMSSGTIFQFFSILFYSIKVLFFFLFFNFFSILLQYYFIISCFFPILLLPITIAHHVVLETTSQNQGSELSSSTMIHPTNECGSGSDTQCQVAESETR